MRFLRRKPDSATPGDSLLDDEVIACSMTS
jgi:hypothetical protein